MRVAQVMSSYVRAVGQWEELEVPADLARFGRFSALPVVDQMGQLVGMIERADLIERAAPSNAPRRFKVADMVQPKGAVLRPDDEIDQAARAMLAARSSVSPVLDSAGNLVGLLTDSELLAVLTGRRAPVHDLEEVEVRQVMTPSPTTIDEGATLADAAREMVSGGFRELPVVDEDGNLSGIITERALREKLGTALNELAHAAPEATDDVVANSMAPDPPTVRANARLLDAIDQFADEPYSVMPVLDENDRLVGILSYVDVLNWLRERKQPWIVPGAPAPAP
jgi:CBS domain-containing protein